VLALLLAVAAFFVVGLGPGFAALAGVGVLVLVQLPGWLVSRGRHGELTDSGTVAAEHWLGVREYLRADGGFTDAPPTSVAIWGPYLAYAVALDATGFKLRIAASPTVGPPLEMPAARYPRGVAN
jgi:uncharacterized membrane protein